MSRLPSSRSLTTSLRPERRRKRRRRRRRRRWEREYFSALIPSTMSLPMVPLLLSCSPPFLFRPSLHIYLFFLSLLTFLSLLPIGQVDGGAGFDLASFGPQPGQSFFSVNPLPQNSTVASGFIGIISAFLPLLLLLLLLFLSSSPLSVLSGHL